MPECDFIVVGAQKSATSWLADCLQDHPGVEVSVPKEPNFHVRKRLSPTNLRVVPTLQEYHKCWSHRPGVLRGECSVLYLPLWQESIPSILETSGDATKIVIVLREPTSRAESAYFHSRKSNPDETLSFPAAVHDRSARQANTALSPSLDYVGLSLYAEAVVAFKKNFKNVLILKYDHIRESPEIVLEELQAFLGITGKITPAPAALVNQGYWRWSALERLTKSPLIMKARLAFRFRLPTTYATIRRGIFRRGMTGRTRLSSEEINSADLSLFREDLIELQQMVPFDISDWLDNVR